MRRQNKKETKGEGKMTCYSGEQIRSGEEMLTASQTGSPLNKQTNKELFYLLLSIICLARTLSFYLISQTFKKSDLVLSSDKIIIDTMSKSQTDDR